MSAMGSHGDGVPVGGLVTRASRQISEPVREETRPARAETTREGRRYGRGGGLLGSVGLVGFLAAQALVTAAIAALAALPGVAGKKQVDRAGSPDPEKTIDRVKADAKAQTRAKAAEIKERVAEKAPAAVRDKAAPAAGLARTSRAPLVAAAAAAPAGFLLLCRDRRNK
ncbi:phage holin family protein [Streptomyces sp. NPDC017868]|uniref:phage holin family protein n=1 Tax=Streptomyces sp. NPDC017868 TaxID=3365014 RepID=UPI00379A0D5F